MSDQQVVAFAILGATLALFVWGRWRYDVVAVLALLACVLTGLVAPSAAFTGFAHPAVITVAAVLIISKGLQNAGLVDAVVKIISPLRGRVTLQITAQCVVIAALSSFMNNVGALALMMPVALRNAYRDGYPPGKSLMPLAFASLLGGLTTLIGTPPNIIVASFRADQIGQGFGIFDFTPVGIVIALGGLLFLSTIGWRLLSLDGRKSDAGRVFEIEDYVTEAEIQDDSKAVGMTVFELEEISHDNVVIAGVVHNGERRLIPSSSQRLAAGDILVLRGDADALKAAIDSTGLRLVGDKQIQREDLRSEDIDVIEMVISPHSKLIGATPGSSRLRAAYGVNLLAIARQGHRVEERLAEVKFQSGDVILLQVQNSKLPELSSELGCLPLAERSLGIGRQRRLAVSSGIFALAIALVVSGVLPVHIAFVATSVALVVTNIVRPAEIYTSIDWPVIVLLAAMFPVGGAIEATGGAALLADGILRLTDGVSLVWVLLVLLVGTMCLSDVINNNATAVLMAPIAFTLAGQLGANPDPFLMTVAIGASCAFLTPIGHQCNTLVMEPGGYRFRDFWRVGLPLELIIVVIALPMILWIWPP